jgi:2-dehydro-3-deoxygalactonokinase
MTGPFLACDWGTTNLRAWVVDAQGRAGPERAFASCGVSKLQPGEAGRVFREQVRPAMQAQDMPAMLCGMVGSTLGWRIAPYVACPAGLVEVAAQMLEVERFPPVRIVPGLSAPGITAAPDVMRGEETQILGWMELDESRRRGRRVVCHPGTHAKWALVEDGRVSRFVTAMTGELFAVLTQHSVLKTDGRPDDETAFDEGLHAAGDGGALSARLFSTRARVVGGGAQPASSASYLSGLLIGAEIAAAPSLLDVRWDEQVQLVGEPKLCRWYARAFDRRGVPHVFTDGDQAVVAGLSALYRETSR